jgi:hypothetical protein
MNRGTKLMSNMTIRLLAVSVIALGAGSIGFTQAQAFSFPSSFLLAQAGGGAGPTTGGASGGAGPATGGASGGANVGAKGSGGAGGVGAGAGAGAGGSGSGSAGVPAQCASITDASERQACMNRLGAGAGAGARGGAGAGAGASPSPSGGPSGGTK